MSLLSFRKGDQWTEGRWYCLYNHWPLTTNWFSSEKCQGTISSFQVLLLLGEQCPLSDQLLELLAQLACTMRLKGVRIIGHVPRYKHMWFVVPTNHVHGMLKHAPHCRFAMQGQNLPEAKKPKPNQKQNFGKKSSAAHVQ